MADEQVGFEGWGILELMGHRKLAGYVSEQAIGGASFIRIDVPKYDGAPRENVATQFYSPSAVYCLTPTTEELARKVAAGAQPAPVTRWELPPAPPVPAKRKSPYDDDDDEEAKSHQAAIDDDEDSRP